MKSRLEGEIVNLDEGAALLGATASRVRGWLISEHVKLPNGETFRLGPPPFFRPVGAASIYVALRHELEVWRDAHLVAKTTGIQP